MKKALVVLLAIVMVGMVGCDDKEEFVRPPKPEQKADCVKISQSIDTFKAEREALGVGKWEHFKKTDETEKVIEPWNSYDGSRTSMQEYAYYKIREDRLAKEEAPPEKIGCNPEFTIKTVTTLKKDHEVYWCKRWDEWGERIDSTVLNVQERSKVPLSEIATEKQRQLECARQIAAEAQVFLTQDKTIVLPTQP